MDPLEKLLKSILLKTFRCFFQHWPLRIWNSVRWWDDECGQVKLQHNLAYWEDSGLLDDLIAYKRSCTKKTLKRKKKDNFRAFAASVDMRTDPSSVRRTCRVLKNRYAEIPPASSGHGAKSDAARLHQLPGCLRSSKTCTKQVLWCFFHLSWI